MSARNATAYEVKSEELNAEPDRFVMPAGAYYFMTLFGRPDEKIGIIHGCPCGCGGRSAMWFEGKADGGGPEWSVKGEWPKVTLAPSIGIGKKPDGSFHWHGFLENGEFVEK